MHPSRMSWLISSGETSDVPMNSFWWWFEAASDGQLGHWPRRIATFTVVAVVVLGLMWRAPVTWLLRSFLSWKVDELSQMLQPAVSHLVHLARAKPRG